MTFVRIVSWLQVHASRARAMADVELTSKDGSDAVAKEWDKVADEAIAAMRVLMREESTCSKS